jgi:hypothetical protein
MNKSKDFNKLKRILLSCNSEMELRNAIPVVNQFNQQYKITESSEESEHILTIIDMVKERSGRITENKPSSTRRDFEIAAAETGLQDLKNLKFEAEEELAKRHNVSISDIKKEIEIGREIEKEHKKSLEYIRKNPDASLEDVAQKIAMDHIREKCDYYSDPEDGIIAIEKRAEGELDEATSAASSGAYVGLFSGEKGGEEIVKRDLHKTPTSDAGGMTKKTSKPIGKIKSLKKESKVLTKAEMLKEAGDYASMVGQYDTPGWGSSEFMGTKGKKGKAPVKKGNDHKKTYDYDTGSSTFVKIKDKCKKFPYCNQSPDAIETSKKQFNETDESIEEALKDYVPNKEKIKDSWNKFVAAAKREGKETTIAAGILRKLIMKQEVSEKEIKFLKSQSVDIAKIFGVLTMGVISSALPIALEKLLNKKGISIMPKAQEPLEDEDETEALVESISKRTGKSKKYVRSLIDTYL